MRHHRQYFPCHEFGFYNSRLASYKSRFMHTRPHLQNSSWPQLEMRQCFSTKYQQVTSLWRPRFTDVESVYIGYPEPGKTTVYDTTPTIDLDIVSLAGGILVKTLVVSVDPYQRGKMREPNTKSYAVRPSESQDTKTNDQSKSHPISSANRTSRSIKCSLQYLTHRRLYNYGIGRVLRSDHSDFKVGDHVTGQLSK